MTIFFMTHLYREVGRGGMAPAAHVGSATVWSWVRVPPIPEHMLTSILWIKSLGWQTSCQEVSMCRTRGESEEWRWWRWWSMKVRDPPWLWNPGQMSPSVQNKGIIGPLKRTNVLQIKKSCRLLNCIITSSRLEKKTFYWPPAWLDEAVGAHSSTRIWWFLILCIGKDLSDMKSGAFLPLEISPKRVS